MIRSLTSPFSQGETRSVEGAAIEPRASGQRHAHSLRDRTGGAIRTMYGFVYGIGERLIRTRMNNAAIPGNPRRVQPVRTIRGLFLTATRYW
jgi:hypothetical protein